MTDDDEKENEEGEQQAGKEMAELLVNVKEMTLYNMSVLASQAWHHLGLVPIPGADESGMDLEQAKMAIDLLEADLNIMSAYIGKDVEKTFRQTLMDLQLNFVNKSK